MYDFGDWKTINGNRVFIKPIGQKVAVEKQNFKKHYDKHVVDKYEYGRAISETEYLKKMYDFCSRNDVESMEYKNGLIKKFDRQSTEYASMTRDGIVVTYFIAKVGKNGTIRIIQANKYWDDELKEAKKKGLLK